MNTNVNAGKRPRGAELLEPKHDRLATLEAHHWGGKLLRTNGCWKYSVPPAKVAVLEACPLAKPRDPACRSLARNTTYGHLRYDHGTLTIR